MSEKQQPQIETTLGSLERGLPALKSVATKIQDKDVPAKVKYHVGKLCRLVDVEIETFDKMRTDLVKELGDQRDPTPEERAAGKLDKVYQVKAENGDEFVRRYRDAESVRVTIQWGPIQVDWLEKTNVSSLEMGQLIAAGLLGEPA